MFGGHLVGDRSQLLSRAQELAYFTVVSNVLEGIVATSWVYQPDSKASA